MTRKLLPSAAFLRAARRMAKRHPDLGEVIQTTLQLLAEEAFNPRLRTHKLKGELDGFWACSAGYDLRIVFSFVDHEGSEVILLASVGTHDEVY